MSFDSAGTFTRWGGANVWKGDASAGTKILSSRHDDHDQEIANGLSECLTRSGKGAPTVDIPWGGKKLINLAAPTNDADAATKGYVDAAITTAQTAMTLPPGVMMPYTKSASVPTGWLYCNGQAVSRATYSVLFALIGTQFGTGDGSSTFNLPDMRGQFLRGWADNSATLDVGRAFGSVQANLIGNHVHPATAGNITADHTHAYSGNTGTDSVDHTHGTPRGTSTPGAGASSFYPATGNIAPTPTGGVSNYHTHAYGGSTGGVSTNHTHAITTFNNTGGGAETRPANIALVWLIKT